MKVCENTKIVKRNLKIARLKAGYDRPKEFVDALNQYLAKNGVEYRVNLREYYFAEKTDQEKSYKIDVQMAFAISEFLHLPIEMLVQYVPNEKILV